jgi:pyridoxamine 5'-phosphate oxidase
MTSTSAPDGAHGPGDYAAHRLSYAADAFSEADLAANPLAQFERWFADAVAAGVIEPNAMALATVDADGRPATRFVLLKAADGRGFTFFTNYGSRKAAHLDGNPHAALTFGWLPLFRQVSVRGIARRVDREETVAYFRSRPWGSRIGAWASHQSQPVADAATLAQRFDAYATRWPDLGGPDDVPVPEHWGGFLVVAEEIEFWQGRESRVHDRLVFVATSPSAGLDDSRAWRVERRQP